MLSGIFMDSKLYILGECLIKYLVVLFVFSQRKALLHSVFVDDFQDLVLLSISWEMFRDRSWSQPYHG